MPAASVTRDMSLLNFPSDRPIDLACLGRVAVDLYAQQYGSRLEDARDRKSVV